MAQIPTNNANHVARPETLELEVGRRNSITKDIVAPECLCNDILGTIKWLWYYRIVCELNLTHPIASPTVMSPDRKGSLTRVGPVYSQLLDQTSSTGFSTTIATIYNTNLFKPNLLWLRNKKSKTRQTRTYLCDTSI